MDGSPRTVAEQLLGAPGDHEVDAPLICVLTRFGLRSARDLLHVYRDYRRVVETAREVQTPGLLRSSLLIEPPRACYSLSIWRDIRAITDFGTNVPAHVDAANAVFGRLSFDRERGPELWSTKWRLVSVSNNLNWGDFDLRSLLLDMAVLDESPRR
jgi:hypothetical protein